MPVSSPEVLLLFPNQLYAELPALPPDAVVVFCEEPLFFSQFQFHQQKLVLHRASMQAYRQRLEERGQACQYVEAHKPTADVRQWIAQASAAGLRTLHLIDVVDDWLRRRIDKAAQQAGISLLVHPTPNFLNTAADGEAFFAGRKKYFQTDFYVAQRKQRGLREHQKVWGNWVKRPSASVPLALTGSRDTAAENSLPTLG